MRHQVIRSYSDELESLLSYPKVKVIGTSVESQPILLFNLKNKGAKHNVFLSGTVHGNEPIGFFFLKDFIVNSKYKNYPNINFTIIPCVNPDGYNKGERNNSQDIDLNRDFSKTPKSKEAKLIMKELKKLNTKFDFAIDLHESGGNTPGVPEQFYMWEICSSKKNRVGTSIISNLYKNSIPTCNWTHIFEDENNNGVIFYPENKKSKEYTAAKSFDVFLAQTLAKSSITTETCIHDSFSYRVKTLTHVLQAVKVFLGAA